jgi:alkanesulfonate monooxygenase SsuD/methylene tetrahydromethanopterin reductase-like flavin-dependent oxidoreductase (luciferase family)
VVGVGRAPYIHDAPGGLAAPANVSQSAGDEPWLACDGDPQTSDCWTILAAFAAVTKRLRLGPLVSCVFYRTPFQLARQAADVDRLSNGRLVLGLGTGSYEPEFVPMDLPLPSLTDRRHVLRATLRDLDRLWASEAFWVNWAERRIEGAALRCGPVQQPRVPLLIGGGGERVTLRRVAEAADMCNIEEREPQAVRHKFDVLHAHCDVISRPYESILRSHLRNRVLLAPTESALQAKVEAMRARGRGASIVGWTPRQMIAYYEPLVGAGVQYVIVNLTQHEDIETVELLAEQVVPALRALKG